MSRLLGYYTYSGDKLDNDLIHLSNYVQLELCGSHALTEKAVTLVSTQCLPAVVDYKWYLGKDGYPTTYQSTDGEEKFGRGIKMHRLLASHFMSYGLKKKSVIDHINRNKLDNRLENLRVCSSKQNSYNTSKPKSAKKGSKYKGVQKNGKTWSAVCTKDGKRHVINGIKSEKEAAEIYDVMAEELFREYAGKNFENDMQ